MCLLNMFVTVHFQCNFQACEQEHFSSTFLQRSFKKTIKLWPNHKISQVSVSCTCRMGNITLPCMGRVCWCTWDSSTMQDRFIRAIQIRHNSSPLTRSDDWPGKEVCPQLASGLKQKSSPRTLDAGALLRNAVVLQEESWGAEQQPRMAGFCH